MVNKIIVIFSQNKTHDAFVTCKCHNHHSETVFCQHHQTIDKSNKSNYQTEFHNPRNFYQPETITMLLYIMRIQIYTFENSAKLNGLTKNLITNLIKWFAM